jgi:1-deoxy-D-xylulose 5-phosphate reductoisomerase
VESFLDGRIAWWQIAAIVEETLSAGAGNADEVSDVLDADRAARERAADIVDRRSTE